LSAWRRTEGWRRWLGPEDIGVCQIGTVQSYKTHVVLNAHTGNQDFYVHYKCPLSLS
jgi:hypothetical protein